MKDVVYEDEAVMEYVENFFIPIEVHINLHPDEYGFKVFGTPAYYSYDQTVLKLDVCLWVIPGMMAFY